MAKYDIIYACGHSDIINLIGPSWRRESRLAYLSSGECFECYKKHSTEQAQQEAEQLELPPLVGTENQVSWAETLRIQKFAEIEKYVENLSEKDKEYRLVLMALEKISNETSAKKWIEWRYSAAEYILNEVFEEMKDAPTVEQIQAEREKRERADAIKRQALLEATIRPEVTVSEIAAEIQLHENVISVRHPERRNDFKELVKSLGYSWSDSLWKRTIDGLAGNPADRAIELGHMLLAHGFIVRMFDEVLRARIVSGDFEPERTRWITKIISGPHLGWFAIKWGHAEDYYHVSRRLPNSKYSSPYVVAPPAQFEQVLDFAQMYDFKLSDGAQVIINQAREDKEKTLMVSMSPARRQEKIVAPDKPSVLEVPEIVEIADELRDD